MLRKRARSVCTSDSSKKKTGDEDRTYTRGHHLIRTRKRWGWIGHIYKRNILNTEKKCTKKFRFTEWQHQRTEQCSFKKLCSQKRWRKRKYVCTKQQRQRHMNEWRWKGETEKPTYLCRQRQIENQRTKKDERAHEREKRRKMMKLVEIALIKANSFVVCLVYALGRLRLRCQCVCESSSHNIKCLVPATATLTTSFLFTAYMHSHFSSYCMTPFCMKRKLQDVALTPHSLTHPVYIFFFFYICEFHFSIETMLAQGKNNLFRSRHKTFGAPAKIAYSKLYGGTRARGPMNEKKREH